VGTPGAEQPAPARSSSRADLVAGVTLVIGLLATIPPWHRAGSLSGTLSAWLPSSDLPVFVAAVALAGAGGLTLAGTLLRRPGRGPIGGAAALSAVAAVAVAFSLLRAPDFYAFTAAPFVALAAALAAAVLCVIRVRRLTPPAAGRNLPIRSRV
jgi:hypothetical protein